MVILINTFTVFDGKEEVFLDLWERTGAIFQESSGYMSARLCRALADQPPGQKAAYTHVNVAEWASADAYQDALQNPALRKLVGEYAKVCTFSPALYEIIRDV